MPDEAAREALALATELRTIVGEISSELGDTAAFGRRTRRLSIALTVSVVIDILLSVILGLVIVHEANNTMQIHASQLRACRIGNQARVAQRRLWSHVIAISERPRPGQTKQERAQSQRTLHDFQVFIGHEFRNVDCGKLYSVNKGG